MNCMFPDCGREAATRGLCPCHYQTAQDIVKRKKIATWEELEAAGKCKPRKHFITRSRGDWFVDFKKTGAA